jgi:hypothetical protein
VLRRARVALLGWLFSCAIACWLVCQVERTEKAPEKHTSVECILHYNIFQLHWCAGNSFRKEHSWRDGQSNFLLRES